MVSMISSYKKKEKEKKIPNNIVGVCVCKNLILWETKLSSRLVFLDTSKSRNFLMKELIVHPFLVLKG